jgi:hypothetical protein
MTTCGLRLILLALVLALTVRVPGAARQAATPVAAGTGLDLASIVLTPDDLAPVGLTGFERKGNGDPRAFADYVAGRADYLNKDPDELEQILTDAGWQAGYTTNLGKPTEPGNPESVESAIVFISVFAYADADGAATGYDVNRDYSGVTNATIDTMLAPEDTLGDASFTVRTLGDFDPEAGPSDEVAIVLRVDRLVAAVGIITFGLTEADLATPAPVDPGSVEQVQALAEIVAGRMSDALAGTTPGLFPKSLRLGGSADLVFVSEGYRLIRGSIPPYYGGFEDDFPDLAAEFDFEAVYEINQAISAPTEPFYVQRLYAFATDAEAEAFVETRRAQPLEGGQIVEGVLESGVLVAYDAEPEPGFHVQGYSAHVVAGSTVAWVLIEGPERPAESVIAELVAAQVACLEAKGPCPPIDPPAALLG